MAGTKAGGKTTEISGHRDRVATNRGSGLSVDSSEPALNPGATSRPASRPSGNLGACRGEARDAGLDHLVRRGEADPEPAGHLDDGAGQDEHPVARPGRRRRPRRRRWASAPWCRRCPRASRPRSPSRAAPGRAGHAVAAARRRRSTSCSSSCERVLEQRVRERVAGRRSAGRRSPRAALRAPGSVGGTVR